MQRPKKNFLQPWREYKINMETERKMTHSEEIIFKEKVVGFLGLCGETRLKLLKKVYKKPSIYQIYEATIRAVLLQTEFLEEDGFFSNEPFDDYLRDMRDGAENSKYLKIRV